MEGAYLGLARLLLVARHADFIEKVAQLADYSMNLLRELAGVHVHWAHRHRDVYSAAVAAWRARHRARSIEWEIYMVAVLC